MIAIGIINLLRMYLFSTTRPASTMASVHVDYGAFMIYESDNDTDTDVIVHRQ